MHQARCSSCTLALFFPSPILFILLVLLELAAHLVVLPSQLLSGLAPVLGHAGDGHEAHILLVPRSPLLFHGLGPWRDSRAPPRRLLLLLLLLLLAKACCTPSINA